MSARVIAFRRPTAKPTLMQLLDRLRGAQLRWAAASDSVTWPRNEEMRDLVLDARAAYQAACDVRVDARIARFLVAVELVEAFVARAIGKPARVFPFQPTPEGRPS